jgi:hypothetical protein
MGAWPAQPDPIAQLARLKAQGVAYTPKANIRDETNTLADTPVHTSVDREAVYRLQLTLQSSNRRPMRPLWACLSRRP